MIKEIKSYSYFENVMVSVVVLKGQKVPLTLSLFSSLKRIQAVNNLKILKEIIN